MVLIGKRKYKYGYMQMSHMVASSLEELHAFAALIGVNKRHFQNKPNKPHYDICQEKKEFALTLGAEEVDDRTIVTFLSQTY